MFLRLSRAVLCFLIPFAVVGCPENKQSGVEEAVEEVQDEAQDAVEEVKDEIDDATTK